MIEEIKKSISDRERKYRLRDKEKKERYGQSDDNMLTWYGFSLFGECTLMGGMPPLSYLPNLIQSDYTGLNDKNGKEIYEGDIYKVKGIKWCKDGVCKDYDIIGDMVSFICDYVGGQEGTLPSDMEVIGNIFENPDLIK